MAFKYFIWDFRLKNEMIVEWKGEGCWLTERMEQMVKKEKIK